MKGIVYLTSGNRILRFPSHKDNLHILAIFGIRGRYIGSLKYRDEDIAKLITTIRDGDPPPEG